MAMQQSIPSENVFNEVETLVLAQEGYTEPNVTEIPERFAADTSWKYMDATQLYLNEIGFSPLLSAEEEVHFARLARKGDEKGRKRMI